MMIGQYETHPAADAFPLIDDVAFEALCSDIKGKGLLTPIVRFWVVEDGGRTRKPLVLDGRNRLRACLKARVKPEWTEYEGDDPYGYVVSHNLVRRHLDESQRALVAAKIAKLRVGANQHTEGGQIRPPSQEQAAELLSVGKSSVKAARTVLEKAEPELVRAVERGDIAVSFAAQLTDKSADQQREVVERVEKQRAAGKTANPRKVVRDINREAAIERISAEPAPLPEGPFRVIDADPAWPYDNELDRGGLDYPTMTLEQICALPIGALAHDDSVLLLWITNAHLIEGAHIPVLKAWGFIGKTILTWVKDRMGVGTYLRGKTEHCILAVRGNPTINLSNQTTELQAPRREHSRKPDEFYAMIEGLLPGSKLKIFGREAREGWVVWGAEAEKFDEQREAG